MYQAAAAAYYYPQQFHPQAHTPPPPPVIVRSPLPHQVTKPPPPPSPPPPPPAPVVTSPVVVKAAIPPPPPPPVVRTQYQPQLPWYSAPDEPFPRRRRRRKAPALPTQVPAPAEPVPVAEETVPVAPEVSTLEIAQAPSTVSDIQTPTTTCPPSEAGSTIASTPISTAPPAAAFVPTTTPASVPAPAPTPAPAPAAIVQKPVPAVPAVPIPALPAVPIIKAKAKSAPKSQTEPAKPVTISPLESSAAPKDASVKEPAPKDVTPKDVAPKDTASKDATPVTPALPTAVSESAAVAPPPPPAAPKSWADLVKVRNAVASAGIAGAKVEQQRAVVIKGNGIVTNSLSDILINFTIPSEKNVTSPFLEPRGLVNTGNMCFMNAVLQMLVFCGPFYYFLDHLSKQVAHSFKTDTPLIDAMIMFMREFRVISPSAAQSQPSTLKAQDFEAFGEPFVPEFLYEVIRSMQSFAHMKRGHQQDAEEFLGFLLDGLHEEAIKVMSKSQPSGTSTPTQNGTSTPTEESLESGWMEVGHKQRTLTTRTTEIIESPITKIFGGKLRSEFKVPGLKTSVTLEPYTPLQLDIQSPDVRSVTDALRHMAVVEKLQGDYNPAKGPNVTATKQVLIETLPPVLILQLKRFQYDNTSGVQKIWKRIGYPLVLEIPPEAMSHNKRAGPPQKYRLIGVVYHHGKSASGGHYTVDVQRQDAKSWIRLDDTVIKRVGSDEVRIDVKVEEEGEEDGWVNAAWEAVNGANGKGTGEGAKWVGEGGKVAYILFYQKF